MPGGSEQIVTTQWRERFVPVIGQPDGDTAVSGGDRQETVEVTDSPTVAIGRLIGSDVTESGDIGTPPLESPAAPGIRSTWWLVQQPELPFQVGIKQSARQAVGFQICSKTGNAGRWFTRFRKWRKYKQHADY